jgi:hypothetical protein
MTREELIEVMAKAIIDPAEKFSFIQVGDLTAACDTVRSALSAIEAAGFAIVPVVASEGMIVAGIKALEMMAWEDVYHDDVTVCHQAMIQAAQEEMK